MAARRPMPVRDFRAVDRLRPADHAHPLCPDHWWQVFPGSYGSTWRNIGKSGRGWQAAMVGGVLPMRFAPPGGCGSVNFDGTNDRGDVPSLAALFAGDHTLAGWMRLTFAGRSLISGGNTSGGLLAHYVVLRAVSELPDYAIRAGAGAETRLTGTTSLTGDWHWLCATRVGTAVTLYVNGLQEDADTFTGTPDTNRTTLGAFGRAVFEDHLNGQADGIMVYSRGLSAREVGSLYLQARRSYPELLNRTAWRTTLSVMPIPIPASLRIRTLPDAGRSRTLPAAGRTR